MKMLRNNLLTLTAAVSIVLPLSAWAGNGMNPEGTGVKNRGMGGSGVALANEAASVITNPAATVNVGDRWDVAFGIFDPSPRGYTLSGQPDLVAPIPGEQNFSGSQTSADDKFLIPFFGMVSPIDNNSAWSFVMSANGGMNTEYATNFAAKMAPVPGFTGNVSGPTGINLEQLFLNGTYSHKVTETVSLGYTAIYAHQAFEAKGLGAFKNASRTPTALTDNGEDTSTGFGFKLGVQVNLGDGLKLGAAYQPKIEMSKFDKYKGLFPDQGQMDIAPTYTVGLGWVVSPQLTIAFDYHYIDYEAVSAISNSTNKYKNTSNGTAPCAQSAGSSCFGDPNGPGFGWKSISVYKLGGEYTLNPTMKLRAGWNHGENPITPEEVTVAFLAPGVTEDHLTLGFTMAMDKTSEINFNYVKSFENSVSGKFAPKSPEFGGGNMTVSMEQQFFEVGYAQYF
ncbi:MAG: outer membrane protein transport protein [Gammaproteobacteria bacterium]|nr:outer membrane protein transport protein [Gammaproteobacteria bacterium]